MEKLRGFGGKVLKTSLSKEDEAKLQQVLAEAPSIQAPVSPTPSDKQQ
jgi:uncharacterized membrane protein